MTSERIGKVIGKGFEAKVFASSFDEKRVIKELPLIKKSGQKIIDMTENIMKTIEIMRLASENEIGPKLYDIFYSQDGKHIYIEMEKIEPCNPQKKDVDEIIELFEKMFRQKFVTFDFEYGKTEKNKWIIFDYGVSKMYPSYKDAIKGAIENDMFEDVGLGYYNPKLEQHFKKKVV